MSSGKVRRLIEAAVMDPPQPVEGSASPLGTHHVLIVDDGSELVTSLMGQCRQQGIHVLLLQSQPLERSAPTIILDQMDPDTVETVVKRIRQITGDLKGILFLSTRHEAWAHQWWAHARERLRSAIAIARAISLTNENSLSFFHFITAQGGRFGLDPDATVNPLTVGLEGLIHPLHMEMAETSFRSIDMDPADSLEAQAQQILSELHQPDQSFRTAYGWKQGQRATLSVREIEVDQTTPPITAESVVVFAGGARGIGAVCAEALAQQTRCKLIFLGRTPLTDEVRALSALSPADRKAREADFIKEYKATHPGCPPREPREQWRRKTRAVDSVDTLKSLEKLGSVVEYAAVDVRDQQAVLDCLQSIKTRHGRLDILVHVAGLGGVETDRMLSRKEWSIIDQVIDVKVAGAVNLLQAAETLQVPLFIGFGSIASRFGNSGQVDYASANSLLSGIARAHNQRGVLPVARVIGWGAWDGVGIAVSGPTKQMLQSYGVEFLTPQEGGEAFLHELNPVLSPQSPAMVYISPNWTGLDDLLKKEASAQVLADGGSAAQASVQSPSSQLKGSLMGSVVEHAPGKSLRAEHWLESKRILFLDHHRYQGTAWVPAVMGMEVGVEAAAHLFPEFQPFAVREIYLKKAVRLVRDEPVLLIAEVETLTQSATEALVKATISASYKNRTWVFAEMQVSLSDQSSVIQDGLDDSAAYQPSRSITDGPGEVLHWSKGDLYPCEWLKFQTHGSTFQVVDALDLNCALGLTEASMTTTTDLSGCYAPVTFIDGIFQAYGMTICTIMQAWSGPPLYIGEIRWLPDVAPRMTQGQCRIWTNMEDKAFPVVHMFDATGQCFLRMQGADQGGTGLKQLASQAQAGVPPSAVPATAGASPAEPTPLMDRVVEERTGQWLRVERVLDPKAEVMLQDHTFHGVAVIPAVYFMEMAAEASARLIPTLPPCELLDFQIGQMLYIVQGSKPLYAEVEAIDAQHTRARLYSYKGKTSQEQLHAEGIIKHGHLTDLGHLAIEPLQDPQSRPRAGLYPHRFPNGPIFQVIETMELGVGHRSRAQLRLTAPVMPHCVLPMAMLDGAFQVESATRSGFDKYSGLPKTFKRLAWVPGVDALEAVICVASTEDGTTESLGELYFVDPGKNNAILLQLQGITLTSQVPRL